MSVVVPNQTVAITRNDLPTPDFRRWQLAITDAVNNPAEAAPVEPVTGDYLPLSTFVRGVDGIAFYGALSTGGVLLGLETLADSGTGALLGIARDAYGRVSGTTDATITGTAGEIDVANGDAVAGPPTLSLANTAVTPGAYVLPNVTFDAKGRATAAASNDAPSDGTGYVRKDGAWAAESAGGGGASAFTPASLFDVSVTNGAWYDPSDLSTMWQDTAGTTPVTTAGQSVARIDDKSGLGNHATQATVGARPTYQVSSDGFHYLSFDGGDYLSCGTAFNANSFMAGCAYMTTVNNARLIDARGTGLLGTVAGWYMKGRNTSADLIIVDDGATGASFNDSASGVSTGTPHVLCARFGASKFSYILDRPDVAGQLTTAASIGSTIGAQPSVIGTASNSPGTQSLTGHIYQIVVINRLGTFNEQRDLYEYMTGKAGF